MVNKLRCILVDDEEHALEVLETFIQQTSLLQVTYKTTDPIQAFQYVQTHTADLLFLDIQMPGLSGMELLKLIPPEIKVILTTAYPEYALKSYEFNVADYLLKPVLFERFLKAVQKVMPTAQSVSPKYEGAIQSHDTFPDHIFIHTDTRGKLIKVNIEDIQYIEALGNYVSIQTMQEKILTIITMKELEEKFKLYPFIIRTHKSFIINSHKIKGIEGNRISIDKKIIPLGDTYKDAFHYWLRNKVL